MPLCPIVGGIFYLRCLIDSDGIAFHYPLDSGIAVDDVLIGCERNVLNGDVAIVDDFALVCHELAVLVTYFGETHLFHDEMLISGICPFALPNVNVADDSYGMSLTSLHRHFREVSTIAVLPCSLHIDASLVIQMQVGQFLPSFIKSHKVLHVILDGDARQGLLQIIAKAFMVLREMKQAIDIVENVPLCDGS